MKSLLKTIAVVTVAFSANFAVAGENSVAVSFADLNLSAPAGKEVLMARLTLAANRVCGSQSYGMAGFDRAAVHGRCVRDAMSRALHALPDSVAGALDGRAYQTIALSH